MTMMSRLRVSVLVGGLLVVTPAVPVTVAHATTTSAATIVQFQSIGNPAWIPVDPHVFTAPIGTAADGYAEFGRTLATVLPPPHYQSYECLGIGPGTPEAPPYTHDVASGVRGAGYPEGSQFAQQGFSNGQGVLAAFMVIPTANTSNVGSSPDYALGPIIPNALFPISVNGVTRRDAATYDPALASFSVPALTDPCVTPAFTVDGSSHFPIFLADNSDFGPPGSRLPGGYEYDVTMVDSTGSGWRITARFTVR